MRFCVTMLLLTTLLAPTAMAAGRAMTVEDLLNVKSVSDPRVSPDGKHVVYVLSELDRSTDKSNSDLYLIPTNGGESKRLTSAPGADNHPRWSPDGKSIAFNSTRSGSRQVWILPVDGGEARQLTKLPIDANEPVWSPTGDRIAIAASVYPGKTPEETAAQDEAKAKEKANVRIYHDLMIRHWDQWTDGKKSHLFTVDVATGEATDMTPGFRVNIPPAPFGGSSDYAFSTDGKELAFTAEPLRDLAWSTNTDIWVVPTSGGEARNITEANLGADAQPSYCPMTPNLIAYVSQQRAGFEADRWVLKAINHTDTKRVFDISGDLDRPILSFSWFGLKDIAAVADDKGRPWFFQPDFTVGANGTEVLLNLRTIKQVGTPTGSIGSISFSSSGSALGYTKSSVNRPAEVFMRNIDGEGQEVRLTHHNDALINDLDLPPAESFQFAGADGDTVSGWLIKPPNFNPSKKYPVVFLIHGGPQGAWHDDWHPRWNYNLFAAPGYAVVAINPRGSTGYGQKFTDQISRDWTGRVYEDLMKGLDHALKTYPFLDESRMAAAGGSYGGFMVNWIAGHSDRFKALISHAGVYDLAGMYGTTEELWFAEWEFGGPPWTNPKLYADQAPANFAANFRTPTLITHGSMDFRVPETQGIGFFTALRRQGIDARLVIFPEENHWILKPANRIIWWREMRDWLAKYLK